MISPVELSWGSLVVVAISSTLLSAGFLFAHWLLSGRSLKTSLILSKASIVGVFLSALVGIGYLVLGRSASSLCQCSVGVTSTFHITSFLGILWIGVFSVLIFKDIVVYRRFKKTLSAVTLQKQGNLSIVEDSVVAASFGIRRAQIVIPLSVASDAALFEHVYAHERTHVENKDALWNLISLFVLRLAWFNPLMAVCESRRRLTMEMLTDQMTVQRCGFSKKAYCESLLKVAEIQNSGRSLSLFVNAVSDFNELKMRIQNLNENRKSGRASHKVLAISVMLTSWAIGVNSSVGAVMVQSRDLPLVCTDKQEVIIQRWFENQIEVNRCE